MRSDLGNDMVVGAACQLQLKKAPTQEERHANMLVRFSSRLEGEGMTDSAHTPPATSTCQALEVTVAALRGPGQDGAPAPGLNDLYFATAENGRFGSVSQAVSRTIIADIWVAFFQECQQ